MSSRIEKATFGYYYLLKDGTLIYDPDKWEGPKPGRRWLENHIVKQ